MIVDQAGKSLALLLTDGERCSPRRTLRVRARAGRRWSSALLVLLAACSTPPALVRYQEELKLLHQIEAAFGRSVDAEKSAVLASTDAESEAFAGESKAAAREVDRYIRDLEGMLRVDGSAALAKADLLRTAWEHLKAIDERLLGLAVANTNLKAMRLSVGDAASALDRFIAVLEEMITASSDPARIRELSIASIAAMRIQTLHGPHIVSTDDQEMDRLEGKMGTSRRALESVLSKLRLDPESAGSSPLREATTAWADYERATSEVIRLSRENTNLRSFDLSIHEKRRATEAFRNALADLAREIQSSVSHATR